jgi:hypothetical protein
MRNSHIKFISPVLPVLLIIGLVYPFEMTVVPQQNILVVTEDMRPIRGKLVRQVWQHYSLESQGHEEDLLTDENGRVSFARRTIRASFISQAIGAITNISHAGVHASFGVDTYILVLWGGTPNDAGPVVPRWGDIVYRIRS